MPVHYRIARDRSNRDDDAMIAPVIVAGEPWDCPCGSENVADDRHCWWCKAERGDWLCPCGRRNRKGDAECSECGRPKPDDE